MNVLKPIKKLRRWLIEMDLREWRWPGDAGPTELLQPYLAAGGTEERFYACLSEGADEDDGM